MSSGRRLAHPSDGHRLDPIRSPSRMTPSKAPCPRPLHGVRGEASRSCPRVTTRVRRWSIRWQHSDRPPPHEMLPTVAAVEPGPAAAIPADYNPLAHTDLERAPLK